MSTTTREGLQRRLSPSGARGRVVSGGSTPGAQFLRYVVVGLTSAATESALLVALYGHLGVALWAATSVAFGVAFALTFGLNFTWVFRTRARPAGRLVRYGCLVGLNYLVTLAVVLGLSGLGLHYLLAKWAAIGFCVALNFLAYRSWVFA